MKYELTDESIVIAGKRLYRIKALKDFGNVEKGNLGGYIECEENLSQEGTAWVYDNAQVYNDARVYGNARVYDNARVYGEAWVYDDAQVYGEAWVYDDAQVYDNAQVYNNTRVYDNAQIYGNAWVHGRAWVYGNAKVYGEAWVCDNAYVYGVAQVYGAAQIGGNACICDTTGYIAVQGFGGICNLATFFREENGIIAVRCGSFYGSLDRFRKHVKTTHGNGKLAREYLMLMDLMEYKFSDVERQ